MVLALVLALLLPGLRVPPALPALLVLLPRARVSSVPVRRGSPPPAWPASPRHCALACCGERRRFHRCRRRRCCPQPSALASLHAAASRSLAGSVQVSPRPSSATSAPECCHLSTLSRPARGHARSHGGAARTPTRARARARARGWSLARAWARVLAQVCRAPPVAVGCCATAVVPAEPPLDVPPACPPRLVLLPFRRA